PPSRRCGPAAGASCSSPTPSPRWSNCATASVSSLPVMSPISDRLKILLAGPTALSSRPSRDCTAGARRGRPVWPGQLPHPPTPSERLVMNAPAALFAIRCLVRDTFRQARASGIFWLMLGVSLICIVLCLSVSIQGDLPLHADGPDQPELLPRS